MAAKLSPKRERHKRGRLADGSPADRIMTMMPVESTLSPQREGQSAR
jgi:hypothetical protein